MEDKKSDAARVQKIERLIAASVLEIADLLAWERADVTHLLRAHYSAEMGEPETTV